MGRGQETAKARHDPAISHKLPRSAIHVTQSASNDSLKFGPVLSSLCNVDRAESQRINLKVALVRITGVATQPAKERNVVTRKTRPMYY